MKTPAESLRGSLKEHTVDARRIMQAAKNPACAVSRTAMLAGIDMEEMAKRAFGEALESHLSPFAIRQGNMFERSITENGARQGQEGEFLRLCGCARACARRNRGFPPFLRV